MTASSRVSLTLHEIVNRLGGELFGPPDLVVVQVATLDAAGPTDISFLASSHYRQQLERTQAGAVILSLEDQSATDRPRIVSDQPYLYFARVTQLWKKSQGIHLREVSAYHEAKSVSSENTFDENTADQPFLYKELVRLTERICYELRQDGKVAGCVAVKIRYPDFETTSRQTTIPYTCADDEIIPVVKSLFQKLYKKGTPVRLLGVRLSELTNDAVQTNLFSDTERKSDLYKAIDEVKNRFGKAFVKRASSG